LKNLFYSLTINFLFVSILYSQNTLSIDYNGGDSLKINLINEVDVSGFELVIDGVDIVSILASDSAQSNGFDIALGPNGILGFSFTGGYFPIGEHHLLTAYFNVDFENIASPCLSAESGSDGLPDCVISSTDGNSLPLELGECVSGCFENTACNYLTSQDCTSATVYYQDADADELGNPDVSQSSCEAVEGYVTDNTDDDDSCSGSVASDGSCCNSEIFDECGICDGDNSTCSDCAGVPNGDAIIDECGVCNGDNSTCLDCAGVPNGNALLDACGNCDGDCIEDITQDGFIVCSGIDNTPENLVTADCLGVCGGSDESCLSINKVETPTNFGISSAYPNPFNPSINIEYSLPLLGKITVNVIGIDGRHVQTLVSGIQSSGLHSLRWTPKNVASGMYLIQLQTTDQVQSKKILYLK